MCEAEDRAVWRPLGEAYVMQWKDVRYADGDDCSCQWSLGVTLWELATLGAAPLAELDAADAGAFLGGGYRPSQPHNCPDEM